MQVLLKKRKKKKKEKKRKKRLPMQETLKLNFYVLIKFKVALFSRNVQLKIRTRFVWDVFFTPHTSHSIFSILVSLHMRQWGLQCQALSLHVSPLNFVFPSREVVKKMGKQTAQRWAKEDNMWTNFYLKISSWQYISPKKKEKEKLIVHFTSHICLDKHGNHLLL